MEMQASIPSTPVTLKPGVFSSYGNGWRQLWKHFWELLLILIIAFLLSLPFSVATWVTDASDLLSRSASASGLVFGLIGFLYALFFTNVVDYGVSFAFLKAARADKVEIGDIFAAFKNYWNAVGASILVGIIVFVGFVFLIVPGIFLAVKLAFVPYLVVDKRMGVGSAINESWRLTRGHAWKVFLIILLAIPIAIAGLIVLLIGVIPAGMWIYTAIASLYHAVSTHREGEKTVPSPIIS